MKIENAKYRKFEGTDINASITATLNGVISHVPLDPANSDYAEIMRQVDAGELTIEEAE